MKSWLEHLSEHKGPVYKAAPKINLEQKTEQLPFIESDILYSTTLRMTLAVNFAWAPLSQFDYEEGKRIAIQNLHHTLFKEIYEKVMDLRDEIMMGRRSEAMKLTHDILDQITGRDIYE